MTRPETEAQFQAAVIALAEYGGWRVMHVRRSVTGAKSGRWTTATSVSGWPDLVLWRRGQILYRELKSDTGRVSATQREVLESLAEAGADVAVWRPRDWDTIKAWLVGK